MLVPAIPNARLQALSVPPVSVTLIAAAVNAKAEGAQIALADLPQRIFLAAAAARQPPRAPQPIVLADVLSVIETQLIERALQLAKGNKAKAARLLGLTRPRLYRRMVQLGLEAGTRE